MRSTALFVNQTAIAHFTCAICYNVMKDPVQGCTHGHTFCRECLQRAMERSNACPTCKERITRGLVLNLIVKNLISESLVYCYTRLPLLENGANVNASSSSGRNVRPRTDHCTWEGKLGDAWAHFHVCGYAGVRCSFRGCGFLVVRRDMAEHKAACQHRIEPCGICGRQMKVGKLAQHVLVCPRRVVACDNHGCTARMAFDMLAAHKAKK